MNQLNLLAYLTDKNLLRKLPFSEEEAMELGLEPLISAYQLLLYALRREYRVIELTSEAVIMKQKIEGDVIYRDITFPNMPLCFEAI